MTARFPRTLAVCLLGLALLAGGCSDDDPVTPPDEDPIGPATPQEAVELLVIAWEARDAAALGHVLHPSYRFLFSPDSDFAPTTLWDRQRELAAGAHLFSGGAGTDFEGTDRPGVAAITWNEAVQVDDWTDAPALSWPVGTLEADFDVAFDAILAGDGAVIEVSRRQTFYVAPDPEDDRRWLIVGQQEHLDLSGESETLRWGALKVIYDDPPEPGPYPFPATPDLALANFRTAWTQLDAQAYEHWVLGGDYGFRFVEGSPYEPEGGWTRADELTVFGNLAEGRGGWNPVAGTAWPPVAEVEFRALLRLNDWDTLPPDHAHFPNTSTALYDVEMVWHMEGGYYTKTIQGQQLFHLAQDAYTINGVAHDRWRVVGQTDLTTEYKANEDVSWGAAKACYLYMGQPAR